MIYLYGLKNYLTLYKICIYIHTVAHIVDDIGFDNYNSIVVVRKSIFNCVSLNLRFFIFKVCESIW